MIIRYMLQETILLTFMGSFSIFMLGVGVNLIKKEISIEKSRILAEKTEKQTQTVNEIENEMDKEYPGIEYVEVIQKKTKSSSCSVM